MIKNRLRSKMKWPIGLFVFFAFLSLFLFFLKNQHPQKNEEYLREDLRWEEVKTLITDEEFWATPLAARKYTETVENLSETTNKPIELMNKLIEISVDEKYRERAYFALVRLAFARSRIEKDPQLDNKFKKNFFELIRENGYGREVYLLLDGIGGLSDWYKTPPPQEEREVFLELLTDPDAYPLVRSTTAFFLRNVQEPDLRDKVRTTAEELLVKYRELGLKSRVIGRLHLAIKALKPTSPLLRSSWMRKIVDGVETEVLKGWEIKFARRLSMKELEEFVRKHNLPSYVVHEGSLISETERLRSVPPGKSKEEVKKLWEQIGLEEERQRSKGLVVTRIESPDFLSESQVESIRNDPLVRILIDYKRHRVIDSKEKDNNL